MRPADTLTEEQRAVVAHGEGPAVVKAVAGAGKTTALAHRVRRLVDDGVPPGKILVSSFGRDTVDDLDAGLRALGVSGVETRTIHALAYQLLQATDARSGTSGDQISNDSPDLDPEAKGRILAKKALTSLAADRGLEPADFGFSPSALAGRIAAWKQDLAYPDLDAADLPLGAQKHAHEATFDNDDLHELYHRFEQHRRERGWLTYADMLRSGWEVLYRRGHLRKKIQARYQYVLVDEFQDVSRAQACILDIITAPHRNYMVVGDPDQCIYGWRGADPSLLRGFADRYDGTTYRMTDSFRLPAAPLVLANTVLVSDSSCRTPRLQLTQGFEGHAEILSPNDRAAEARHIVNRVRQLHDNGVSWSSIAVLVRTYGQTPPLERALTEADVPYCLTGAPHFYRRRAVQTLLRYAYWAVLEQQRREDGWFDDPSTAKRYVDRFQHILKRPTRYVPHERILRVCREARSQQTSVLDVLAGHRSALPDRTAERVDAFLDTAGALVDRLDDPAAKTLAWLVGALGYESYLRDTSTLAHLGAARIRNVRALLQYAKGHDTIPALLDDIRMLAHRQQAQPSDADTVDLRSIHRGKGREWPVVIVPGCVDGTVPLAHNGKMSSRGEERRLLYVALTRTRRWLYVSVPDDEAPSPFLAKAPVNDRLDLCRRVGTAFTDDPTGLDDADLVALCRGVVALKLEGYVRRWWQPTMEHAAALQQRLDALRSTLNAARRRRQAYRQARAEAAARQQDAAQKARAGVAKLRRQIGSAPLSAVNAAPDTYFPDDASFSFAWTDNDRVGLFWDGRCVGTLDPLGGHRLDASTVFELPWSELVGSFDSVRQGRERLAFRINWAATAERRAQVAADAVSPPSPPGDQVYTLCDEEVQRGLQLLCDVLASTTSTMS